MKKIFFSLLLVGAVTAVSAQDLPSADVIIDKYLTAIGGKDAIAKIEDLTISTMAESQRGTMEAELKVKSPNKFSYVIYMMGNEVMRSTGDGEKVATVSGFGGNTNARTAEGKDAVTQILQNVPFPEMLYAQYNVQKTVVGKEAVNGKDAWKVELSIPEGRKWNDFFDVESGLKVKRTVEGTPGGQRQAGQGGQRPDGQGQGGQGGQGQGGQGQGGQRGDGQGQGGQRGDGQGQGGQRGGFSGMGGGMMNVTFGDYKEIKGSGVKIPYIREQGSAQFSTKAEVSSVKINKGVKEKEFVIK